MLTLVLPGWIVAFAVMALLWAWHLRLKNAGIVDAGWTALVGGLSVFYALRVVDGMPGRRLAVAAMLGSYAPPQLFLRVCDVGGLRPVRERDTIRMGRVRVPGRHALLTVEGDRHPGD